MHDRDGWIWFDGKCVPWRSATTHVLTHSLHYGLAVIEGVRAYATPQGPAIFRLREHTQRFLDSARVYRLELPYSAAVLEAAQREVVRQNQLTAGYLRPIAFLGSEKLGLFPKGAGVHVAIAAWSWDRYLTAASERGLRVKTSSFARQHVNALPPRAKISANYANSILASLEAQEDGYDEALLLDTDGFVAEGPGENLFIVKNGRLFEPAPTSALSGITRDSVATLAHDLGYEVSERRLTRDDVYLADEAFFCGTAVELQPILELDRRPIGNGKPGKLTLALRAAFDAAVHGRDAKHLDWLTPV
jgi:branched-chain amino acid aminotransferase